VIGGESEFEGECVREWECVRDREYEFESEVAVSARV
jgi:hypothetical protein